MKSKLILLLALIGASNAFALPIVLTPSTPALLRGNQTSEADIVNAISGAISPATQLYKATRSDGSEAGSFAGSYATDFSNLAPLTPSSAVITFTGGLSINSNPVYAFIRDGSYTDYNWYLFNISGWNGTDSITFDGFFPLANGASQNISHVAIYGTGTGTSVPDGGMTIVLFGAAFVGLGMFRRKTVA